MKMLATVLSAAFLALSFSSCKMMQEKYSKNEKATVAYLKDNKTAPAKLNVEGIWYSPQWGVVLLNQEAGGKVDGIFMDAYRASGIVSGRKVFLVLIDDDWTEYTVQLSPNGSEELKGYYSAHLPFSETDQQELVLKRIAD